ncbi:ROK family transcriptional regulator [Solirubrobacter taibaiensis]|nr:ROK family transcriptional regulator [Solirubrobacter taibaiensis]
MTTTKPTLELLRSLSDEHVLRVLMARRQATRAEIAAESGLSKPTVSESVRRLSENGSVVDTGERTTGRGRVGTYYALPDTTGCALVASVLPDGIMAEAVDVYGHVVGQADVSLPRSVEPGRVAEALEQVAAALAGEGVGPFRLAVVSGAGPVDRETGRLVELPDAPALLGALDAPAVLSSLVDGLVTVDNDVNWAARAEHDHGRAGSVRDFVYLFLDQGLGCAVLADGEVRRGHAGLAGEIAHVMTVGPDGAAMRLTDVFAALGLRRSGSTAIDVPVLLRAVGADVDVRDALARSLAGVLSAVVALTDPAVVLIGGAWGSDPGVVEAIARELEDAPRGVPIEVASVNDAPALRAARETALQQLRELVIASAPRQFAPT